MLDVFKSDGFSVVSLTDAVNKLRFVPGRLGSLGLFATTSIATTTIAIEERNGILTLVAPTPRGAPGATVDKSKRSLRSLAVPHFEINDAVMAEEVQNVRAFGGEDAVETVQRIVAERLAIHSQSLEATIEYSRIGAVKGIVTYADGTTMNLFTEFGVSQIGEVDFDLDAANPLPGALRKKCAGIIRSIASELDGVPFSGVHAMCGDSFFDDLIAHEEVRASYLNQQAANELRAPYIAAGQTYGVFEFGGIMWENYRGAVGSTAFIEADKCHIFPLGVPGLFREVHAPADYVETVNTLGQRLYSKQYDMPNGKGVHLDTQTNTLTYCTRPRALIKGKRT